MAQLTVEIKGVSQGYCVLHVIQVYYRELVHNNIF